MKLGKEVEGAFRGLQTLFCQFEDTQSGNLRELIREHCVEHLYVCDHNGGLTCADYDDFALFPVPVTVEVLKYPEAIRSENVRYMLAVQVDPRTLGFFENFSSRDQVKFTSDLYVATALMADFNFTVPTDFDKDTVL